MHNPFNAPAAGQGSFLPEDYIARRADLRANFITLFLFVCVMLMVVSAFFVTNRRWTAIRREQLTINREYALEAQRLEQLERLEKERTRMMGKAEIITALDEKIPRAVLLAELNTRRPRNVTIEEMELASKRIDPNKDAAAQAQTVSKVKSLAPQGSRPAAGAKNPAPKPEEEKPEVKPPRFESSVKITGLSSVYNDITDYAAALQQSTLLLDVELVYIRDAKVKDAVLHKFEISAKLNPAVDARGVSLDQASEEAWGGERAPGKSRLPSVTGVSPTADR
ncbi:MAG: PilN domain-containing protein [Phycisphaeraceae bacterium]|nr:MAG: PilN domain-containing protein [Phycisphaeraceae bacterium]